MVIVVIIVIVNKVALLSLEKHVANAPQLILCRRMPGNLLLVLFNELPVHLFDLFLLLNKLCLLRFHLEMFLFLLPLRCFQIFPELCYSLLQARRPILEPIDFPV